MYAAGSNIIVPFKCLNMANYSLNKEVKWYVNIKQSLERSNLFLFLSHVALFEGAIYGCSKVKQRETLLFSMFYTCIRESHPACSIWANKSINHLDVLKKKDASSHLTNFLDQYESRSHWFEEPDQYHSFHLFNNSKHWV